MPHQVTEIGDSDCILAPDADDDGVDSDVGRANRMIRRVRTCQDGSEEPTYLTLDLAGNGLT
jgi:hypothetical protein